MATILGEKFLINDKEYLVAREISVNRDNADIYLCEDSAHNKYVAKYFWNNTPKANIGYNKYNHFGRRRDGSYLVFNEIKQKCSIHNFLVKHHYRTQHKGKWLILIDYVDGIVLRDYLLKHEVSIDSKVKAIKAFAETLANWHNNGFAHGDPHLSNAMLTIDEEKQHSVKLIDYSLIHHEDFKYCKLYDCFKTDNLRRIYEDYENEFHGKIATGFESDILEIQRVLNIDNILFDNYKMSYQRNINFKLK